MLLMQDMTSFLTIFTVVATFSMLPIFTISFEHHNHSFTYFVIQIATVFFGRQFEQIVQRGFSLTSDADSEEDEDKSWSLADIPIVCFWLKDNTLPTENRLSKNSIGGVGDIIFKLSNLIKRTRNLICTLVWLGILTIHVLFAVYPIPDTARYPDLYIVGNNFLSMAFFGLMLVYAHCQMYEEAIRYSQSAQVGAQKKEMSLEIEDSQPKSKNQGQKKKKSMNNENKNK